MITLHGVSKQYKGLSQNKDSGVALWVKNIISLTQNKAAPTLALSDVSFTVEKGEIFGLYGANGAGKTTLIKILSGLLCPTSGTVSIDGRVDNRHIKNTVSYISTNGWMGLEWQLTAYENLILYGNMFGHSGKALERRCAEILHSIGMTESKGKFISQLSAGMRQKITIARGLILDRPVIYYDEPTVSLDVQASRALRDLIRSDAANNKRTAIIASHSAEDLSICNRIMFISKGRVIETGTYEELARPLSDIQMIEIQCLNLDKQMDFSGVNGILDVVYGNVDGKRDVQSIKISARKGEFSLDALIDHFIRSETPILSIKPKEITLQEIYEHYVAHEGGAVRNAV